MTQWMRVDGKRGVEMKNGPKGPLGEDGVDDGTRTHDSRNHNPGLYQLSYVHHCSFADRAPEMARPAGLEPATLGLEGRCSIRMSYGRGKEAEFANTLELEIGRGRGIRTPDILLPKQARYLTALYPGCGMHRHARSRRIIRGRLRTVNAARGTVYQREAVPCLAHSRGAWENSRLLHRTPP